MLKSLKKTALLAHGGFLNHHPQPDHDQVPTHLTLPLFCTTFTLTYFFQLTSFYWMFLEGLLLFLQVGILFFCFCFYKYQKLDPQVQFPLSLVSIKYKHFLLFGIGGPILNTLIWFFLRLDDQEPLLDVDQEEMMGTKWENGTRSTLCLFFEDRSVDVYVMQVEISSVTPRTSRNSTDTNARHPGLQHLLPHLGHPG